MLSCHCLSTPSSCHLQRTLSGSLKSIPVKRNSTECRPGPTCNTALETDDSWLLKSHNTLSKRISSITTGGGRWFTVTSRGLTATRPLTVVNHSQPSCERQHDG